MTQEEILEGNKLLAEFMSDEPEVLERDLLKAGTLESMCYHSDWNCLMVVVNRIEQIPFYNIKSDYVPYTAKPFNVRMYYRYAKVTVDNDFRLDDIRKDGIVFTEWYESTKQISCFKAVLEFIDWYNKVEKDENSTN